MTTKLVYLYDENYVYAGTYNAQASPLEPGMYLEPVRSTSVNPPIILPGSSAVFSNDTGAWTLFVIPVPDAPVVIPPTLAEVQAAQVVKLQAAYQAAINAPMPFTNAAGVSSTYPAGNTIALNGSTAIQNLNNVLVSGEAAWILGKWLDTANIAQTFTFADLQGLAAAMEAVEVLDWTDLVTKVAEVQNATTIVEVEAIAF